MNLQVSAQIQASSKRYNRLSLCKRNTMDTPAIQKQDLAMPNQMTIAFVLGRLLPRHNSIYLPEGLLAVRLHPARAHPCHPPAVAGASAAPLAGRSRTFAFRQSPKASSEIIHTGKTCAQQRKSLLSDTALWSAVGNSKTQ